MDPLSSEFAYNSTYAFSENTVINAVELEGREKKNSYLDFVFSPLPVFEKTDDKLLYYVFERAYAQVFLNAGLSNYEVGTKVDDLRDKVRELQINKLKKESAELRDETADVISFISFLEDISIIPAKSAKKYPKQDRDLGQKKAPLKKSIGKQPKAKSPSKNNILKFTRKQAKGHLIKHADVFGYKKGDPTLQKKIPSLQNAATEFMENAEEIRVGKWDDTFKDATFYKKGNDFIVKDNATNEFITAGKGVSGNKKYNAATIVK